MHPQNGEAPAAARQPGLQKNCPPKTPTFCTRVVWIVKRGLLPLVRLALLLAWPWTARWLLRLGGGR